MKKLIHKTLVVVMLLLTITGYSQSGVQIIINQSPTLYSVTGGGSYCAGLSGVPIGLSGSEIGVNYQLLINGTPSGVAVAGTGNPINFGTQTMSGIYTITGTSTSTGCSVIMSNTATVQVYPIPSVSIAVSGPVNFCGSGTVTLTANAGGSHTYQWYKNGAIIPGANLNQYVASSTGMYKAVATSSTTGCSHGHDTMIQVHPLPQTFVVSSNENVFCQGSNGVTINLNGSQTETNYQLLINGTPSGVAVAGTGTSLHWNNINTPGTYTVVATNINSCSQTMNGSAVTTMNPLPEQASIVSGPTSVCQGSTAVFSTSSILNATSYIWAVPNGATIVNGQGTSQVSVQFTNTLAGNISVFGENACGGGQPASLMVQVGTAPSLQATANPSSICIGNSTTLTASGNATSFVWGGGATTQSITTSPTANTTYTVTVTGSNGCTNTGSITVNVHPSPNVGLSLVQSQFCTNQTSAILSGGQPSGGSYTGGCVFGNSTIYPSISGSGSWIITYTYTDQYGCVNSATDALTIYTVPNPSFAPIAGQINTDTPPFDLMNYVMPIGGVFTGPGCMTGSSLFNPSAAGPGTHMITYTYTHPVTGCSGSADQYVTVLGTSSGVEESLNESISLYPNPATNSITIGGIGHNTSIYIVDIIGKVVFTTKTDETTTIDISWLHSGSYLMKITNQDGNSITKRFVKTE